MSVQSPGTEPVKPSGPGWPHLVLAVLLAAIGNGWSAAEVRTLGFVLLALVAVGAVASRDR
ncbi:hypothetical protein [Streptomyces sp. NPDC001980]|uniref:hypothetical protein n=1 Tax=Streptomyces sp. NPDC001980 TaxID=3157126 RepID=UPI003331FC14